MILTLFIVSLFALCFLVVLKAFELKFRKTHPLSGTFLKSDEKLHFFVDTVVSKYRIYKKISHIFLFDFIPSHIYNLIVRLKNYLSQKYHMAEEKFRGRRILRNSGSVSFFLDRLTDDKTKADNSNL